MFSSIRSSNQIVARDFNDQSKYSLLKQLRDFSIPITNRNVWRVFNDQSNFPLQKHYAVSKTSVQSNDSAGFQRPIIFLVTETFRAAAEAEANDILKLYNTKGNLVNISPKLPENGPDKRYSLEVVAAYISGKILRILSLSRVCILKKFWFPKTHDSSLVLVSPVPTGA